MARGSEAQPEQCNSQSGQQILDSLVEQLGRPHDELWDSITPDEAPLARSALVRAQEIRNERSDPGDAYLEGIAAALATKRLVDPPADAPEVRAQSIPIPRESPETKID